MAVIGRAELLRFAQRRYLKVPVPWLAPDAEVRIQSLTEGERAKIERSITEDGPSARVRMLIAAVVDENGHAIFADEHAAMLETLDSQAVAALIDAVSEHCDCNGDRLKGVRAEAKN